MRSMFILAAVAATALSTTAGAQAFQNGSFETGVTPGSFTTLAGGSTAITGWVVTGDSIDYIGSYWNADTGSRSIDLNGNGQGGIQQTFSTIIGQAYNVAFSLAGNPDGAPTTKTVVTAASGNGSVSSTFNAAGSTRTNMGWQRYNYGFVANATTTTLSFTSADPGSFGGALDSVVVAAVPEPASWALMIGGFGLVGAAMRRRRVTTGAALA